MTSGRYAHWTAPLRARPALLRALLLANRLLTYAGYVLYPLLLVLVAASGDVAWLARTIAVPAASFAAVTLVRARLNRPRPYEVLGIDPLIHKDTQGKSFPSRHVFSMFMIAMSWLAWCAPVGMALLVLGAAMAVVRVLGGVHWPRDVVAGALVGVICGIVGFWVL